MLRGGGLDKQQAVVWRCGGGMLLRDLFFENFARNPYFITHAKKEHPLKCADLALL